MCDMGMGEESRPRPGDGDIDASHETTSTSGPSTVRLYETRRGFHLAGGRQTSSNGGTTWRVVRIGRLETVSGGLDAVEDPHAYDDDALERLLQHDSPGFVTLVAEGVAVVGTIRLLTGHWLLLITSRRSLGLLCGHVVWGVGDTKLVKLADTTKRRGTETDEQRLRRLLQWVDLARGFFYSETYNLTETLQTNALASTECTDSPTDNPVYAPEDFESAFAWNAHLSRTLRVALGESSAHRWLTPPLCHGYFHQTRVSLSGREVCVTVIARRSRHHAGTRFNRRGVNAHGRCANEVETEQIVDAGESQCVVSGFQSGGTYGDSRIHSNRYEPRVSSATQLRGSVPLFWSQEVSALNARPTIVVRGHDTTHAATSSHFKYIQERYSDPVVCLSLVRSQERKQRESVLRGELAAALHYVNGAMPATRERIACVHWDFERQMKGRHEAVTVDTREDDVDDDTFNEDDDASTEGMKRPNVSATADGLSRLGKVATGALTLTGVFAIAPSSRMAPALARQRSRSTSSLDASSSSSSASSSAMAAWRDAACELVTGVDRFDAASVGGGDSCAPAPGAGSSSDPWRFTCLKSRADPSDASRGLAVTCQRGILRSHCVDCLDRTNVAQFAWGLAALGCQLERLGVIDGDAIAVDTSIAAALMSTYRAMGDVLAMQYGGSQAHHKAGTAVSGSDGQRGGFGILARAVTKVAGSGAKLLTSARRFYSNAYTDADKQEGIDLFLGHHNVVNNASSTRVQESEDDNLVRPRRNRAASIDYSPKTIRWSALEGGGVGDVGSMVSFDDAVAWRAACTPCGVGEDVRGDEKCAFGDEKTKADPMGRSEVHAVSGASERSVGVYERYVAGVTPAADTLDAYAALCDVVCPLATATREKYEPVPWNAADALKAYTSSATS